jgi:hypothetical protein
MAGSHLIPPIGRESLFVQPSCQGAFRLDSSYYRDAIEDRSAIPSEKFRGSSRPHH